MRKSATSKSTKRKFLSQEAVGLKHGFRSGLEKLNQDYLEEKSVDYEYEQIKIEYIIPESSHYYTPDFQILKNGIIIETKGEFKQSDRKKHLLIQQQHPDLDIRFVFSNSETRLGKARKLKTGEYKKQRTYAEWCIQHNFKYADRLIPIKWIKEKPKDG